mmetsp:Transcript_43925/g.88572  ORF Transcript_43925/g.88572 Transcript_43925/m.88572 type:complete len:232 (-) Transcript_43925:543-1238(-)
MRIECVAESQRVAGSVVGLHHTLFVFRQLAHRGSSVLVHVNPHHWLAALLELAVELTLSIEQSAARLVPAEDLLGERAKLPPPIAQSAIVVCNGVARWQTQLSMILLVPYLLHLPWFGREGYMEHLLITDSAIISISKGWTRCVSTSVDHQMEQQSLVYTCRPEAPHRAGHRLAALVLTFNGPLFAKFIHIRPGEKQVAPAVLPAPAVLDGEAMIQSTHQAVAQLRGGPHD